MNHSTFLSKAIYNMVAHIQEKGHFVYQALDQYHICVLHSEPDN